MSSSARSYEEQDRPSSPAVLILFALGAARVPPEPALPGAVLLGLLADLGLSEGAARSAILRMRRSGWLVSQRQGRAVSYAPSEQILAGHRRWAGVVTRPGTRWSGSFHALLVSVPEQARAFRDQLRRSAQIAGYRSIRAGLFIAPSDRREELGAILERIPPHASVVSGWLNLGPEDTRRVANDLWALEELGARYRSLASQAQAAAASALAGHSVGVDALRAFAAATLPIYQAMADDPGLPRELLPAEWPAAETSSALDEALNAFGPAVTAHLADRRRGSTHHRSA